MTGKVPHVTILNMTYSYFQSWDPIKGEVLFHPISGGESIVWYGRKLLLGRTVQEISDMVSFVESELDSFFDHEVHRVQQEITSNKRWDLAEIDEDGIFLEIYDEAKDLYSMVDSNWPITDVLVLVAENWDLNHVGVENVKNYELWAAYALKMYADFYQKFHFQLDFKTMEYVKRNEELSASTVAMLATRLLEASATVNVGVVLNAESKLQKKSEELKSIEKAQAKIKKSEQAIKANEVRHVKTYEKKKIILEMWDKEKDNFSTFKDAGDHFEIVMRELGYKIESETIRSYISKRAKELDFNYKNKSNK